MLRHIPGACQRADPELHFSKSHHRELFSLRESVAARRRSLTIQHYLTTRLATACQIRQFYFYYSSGRYLTIQHYLTTRLATAGQIQQFYFYYSSGHGHGQYYAAERFDE
jgi:hypothetical protein